MKALGRNFLRVASVFFILWGIADIVLYGLMSLLLSIGNHANPSQRATAVTILAVFYLLTGFLQLLAGIAGLRNSTKPEKASICQLWGVLVCVLTIVGSLYNLYQNGSAVSTVLSLLAALVIPGIYLLGAWKNKQTVQTDSSD